MKSEIRDKKTYPSYLLFSVFNCLVSLFFRFFFGVFAAAAFFGRCFIAGAFAFAFALFIGSFCLTFAFAFTAAFFSSFFAFGFGSRSGLIYFQTADGAEDSIIGNFVIAAFAHHYIPQNGQFLLVPCDIGLDLISLHDIGSDFFGVVQIVSFGGVEQAADGLVAVGQLGFLRLDSHIQLGNGGELIGLPYGLIGYIFEILFQVVNIECHGICYFQVNTYEFVFVLKILYTISGEKSN